MQAEGEETWKIRISVWLGKTESWIDNCCMFRFGLRPIIMYSYPYLWGDLLLIFGTTMSMVGWNILGLQPVSEYLLEKISSLCVSLYIYFDIY
jgi:hypothetical protein